MLKDDEGLLQNKFKAKLSKEAVLNQELERIKSELLQSSTSIHAITSSLTK
jgi:hypothetical protein